MSVGYEQTPRRYFGEEMPWVVDCSSYGRLHITTGQISIREHKEVTVPQGSKIDCIYSYSEDGELLCECDGDVCDGTCKVHEPPTVGDREDE